MSGTTLRLILGDQLTPTVSALKGGDRGRDVVLMAEVAEEAGYVRHHRKKLAFVFAAMRAFAAELRALGWRVDYVKLEDEGNSGSLAGEAARALLRHRPDRVVMTEAGEWRVREMQRGLGGALKVETVLLEDDRFVCGHGDFAAFARGRTQLRMETFYRAMRRRTGLLMEGDEPVGGRWNFDLENRKPARPGLLREGPKRFAPSRETRAVLDMVARRFPDGYGTLEPFGFATTRPEAEAARDHFMARSLPGFGATQDAMLSGDRFLNHAVLSPYLNIGLLDPLDLCRRAEAEWKGGRAPIESVEGFVRQILGWREYVRGVYWTSMPGYTDSNALGASRALPWMYWSAETDMACMARALEATRDEAYAHHIQRLMVTGNFALLAGLSPRETHEWYLAVYADAYEWVEAPNTIGMSLFADGGRMASKPYAASGAYIDRMSDYCADCRYDVKAKTGPGACPFNYLYWDFVARHAERLARNPRTAVIARAYDGFDPARKAAVADSARAFLDRLDANGTDRAP